MAESIKNTVKDTVTDVIQVRYTSAKEGIKAPIFIHVVGEALTSVVQQGRLDTLLVRSMDKLGEKDLFMDVLAHGVVSRSTMIKLVEQFVNCHME